MKQNLYTVKTPGDYHHGDLRSALLAAAGDLLSERGVEGFSLREVARRAGVSAAAPKHHFSDVRSLLTALATIAFDDLADRLEAASAGLETERASRIRAQGIAYVRFALDNPGRFDLMWRRPLLDVADADYRRAGDRAFAMLDRLVRGEDAPPLDRDDPQMAPPVACWALVHGFAKLALEGALGADAAAVERATERLLPAALQQLII